MLLILNEIYTVMLTLFLYFSFYFVLELTKKSEQNKIPKVKEGWYKKGCHVFNGKADVDICFFRNKRNDFFSIYLLNNK